jgi:hypothetical protein
MNIKQSQYMIFKSYSMIIRLEFWSNGSEIYEKQIF